MMRASCERWALVLTPLVAFAIVAFGLRVGAPSRVRGARLYAASPGAGRAGLALQAVAVTEEGPLSEVISTTRG